MVDFDDIDKRLNPTTKLAKRRVSLWVNISRLVLYGFCRG